MAVKCGINQPTLDRILKGINALNLNCITSILITFPEVSDEWLLRGEGDMIKVDTFAKEVERISKLNDVIVSLQEVIEVKNKRIKELETQLKHNSYEKIHTHPMCNTLHSLQFCSKSRNSYRRLHQG